MANWKNLEIVKVLEEAMRVRELNRSSLSRELGITHVTVCRWLSGEDQPGPYSCLKVAKFLGISVGEVMSMAGHIPEIAKVPTERLPEFREYIELKYPGLLRDVEIGVFEQLIDRRRSLPKVQLTP